MTGLPIQSHTDENSDCRSSNKPHRETYQALQKIKRHEFPCELFSVPRPGALEQRKSDEHAKHQTK